MELGGMRDRPAPGGLPLRARLALGWPWAIGGALALLLLLVAMLGVQLVRAEHQVERLRAELRDVYSEAESLRTEAVRAQQRAGLLEQQLGQLRAERETLLLGIRRQAAPPKAAPKPRPGARPRPRPAAR
jgi:hypothetical protein